MVEAFRTWKACTYDVELKSPPFRCPRPYFVGFLKNLIEKVSKSGSLIAKILNEVFL